MILLVKLVKLVWTAALTLIVYWDVGTDYDDKTDRLGLLFIIMMSVFFETITSAVTTCKVYIV